MERRNDRQRMCAPFEAKQAVCVSVSLHLIPSWLWLCQYPIFKPIPVTRFADVRSIPVPSFSTTSFYLPNFDPCFSTVPSELHSLALLSLTSHYLHLFSLQRHHDRGIQQLLPDV